MNNININYEQTCSIIAQLNKELQELDKLLQKQDSNFKLLNDQSVWLSPAQDICIKKYQELSKKHKDIILYLDKYKVFLSSVNETFKMYDEQANKNASSLSN